MGFIKEYRELIGIEEHVKEKKRRSKGEKIVFGFAFVFLCIFAGTYVFGLLWMVLNSFKDPWAYALGDTFGVPKGKWLFSNYTEVFTTLKVNGVGFFGMMFNSIWQVVTPTCATLISTMAASYAYARFKFPGRKVVYTIAIVLLTLSFPGSMHASYKLHVSLNLLNTPLFYINSFSGLGTNFIIYAGFWGSIDWAYSEAAYIDGANEWDVLTKIMVPQAKPIFAVTFLLTFVNCWGDATQCLIYLQRMPNIAFGMYEYLFRMQRNMNFPVYFAALTITAIPTLIMFLSFQDIIMTGLNIGGLKG